MRTRAAIIGTGIRRATGFPVAGSNVGACAKQMHYAGGDFNDSKMRSAVQETSLYPSVKRFLEDLGFIVKGEIGNCDIVALSPDATPVVVICELKLQFNLDLVLQGVDRDPACDEVWLAGRLSRRGRGREGDPRFRALCRRLGFGLLGVCDDGKVEVLLSPTALAPRRDPRKRSRLVDEHNRRKGDPSSGGSTRRPIMTAYRQEALACAAAMSEGARRPRDLKPELPNVAKILRRNVYGWFSRVDRGLYCLTDTGRKAIVDWPETMRTGAHAVGVTIPPITLVTG